MKLGYSIIVLLVLIGCGADSVELVSVSGRVTLNDEPLADATVSFQLKDASANAKSKGNRNSFGRTNENGEYTLEVVTTGNSGAVIGLHEVRITKNFEEDDEDDAPEEEPEGQLPERYNSETTLSADVTASGLKSPAGDFKLTTP